MKIFVAYGYNDRDSWIPKLVFPIIEAFGDEVVTGEDEQGEKITDETTQRIKGSEALIAFSTRRVTEGQQANEKESQSQSINDRLLSEIMQRKTEKESKTHRWVTDELAQAIAFGLSVVEIREEGVDDQLGVAGKDRQTIKYKEDERDKCLVALVKTIGRWHKRNNVTLTLLPEECVQRLGPKVRNNPNLRCYYKFLIDYNETEEVKTRIYPSKGGLFVQIKDVPREALIQLKVECDDETWVSNYESTDSYGIYLRKD